MKKRKFGTTELYVSEIGFGAWGIGGPAMAGDIPIGWGEVNDEVSKMALRKAFELGVNFYDTADFYGLGHSESLLGQVFGNNDQVIIATKVGHKLGANKNILLDYSRDHIINACESSLKRLKREVIDYYQLHSAKLAHLKNGESIEAMELLKKEGKIRYWGISLDTFNPFPEGNFCIDNSIGSGFQLVFNIINQGAFYFIKSAAEAGYGIISRMPLQFGLLTGKFDVNSRFEKDDHRSFRLTEEFLKISLDELAAIWKISEKLSISKTALSLSYILNHNAISTTIPGIKTPEQALENSLGVFKLSRKTLIEIRNHYETSLNKLINKMK